MKKQITNKKQPSLFPSFCLYSKRALLNEYAPESEIIQYLWPSSNTELKELLPMFVGVLQSLFTAVNDLPFIDEDSSEDDSSTVEDYLDDSPFTIVGLNTMKLVNWNNMHDLVTETANYKNDICLMIIVSSQLKDSTIMKHMHSIQQDPKLALSSSLLTSVQLGNLLNPLINYWFDH
ncbi:uncharacterized protein BX663DRAFT_533669 [Cokeromyces recurvatus]|uniref:uncharacterized protein n=1 Tax=Cokeromyces recurvatus TaxID=90255 RepID=UPI002220E4AD|nr:uncharacterized protein BX663DRAFT_533669 [Cokeromyces recurvatus]KAI7897766.1 hypothetical protein BX663DRAFT_533669 [Cokeromyces recurvatus]